MSLLDKFRQDNPVYKDVSDNELAPALYNKFYKDKMSSQEFAEAIVGEGYERKEVPESAYYDFSPLGAGVVGAAQGLSFGTADELAGIVGGGISALQGQGFGEGYRNVMEQQQAALQAAREQQGGAMLTGEIAGALGTGLGLGAGANVGRGLYGFGKGLGLGGVSGAAYGAGSGYGGIEERAKSAAQGGAMGLVGGGLGYAAAPTVGALGRTAAKPFSLAKKAMTKLSSKTTPAVNKTLNEIAEQSDIAELAQYSDESLAAIQKVERAIRQDFGEQADDVIKAWKSGDEALIESFGDKIRQLGKGSAQYPTGQGSAERFFGGKISQSSDDIKASIARNISGDENYYTSIDDILEAGRAKARPLYDKVAKDTIAPDSEILQMPEVRRALSKAKRDYPSLMQNIDENSIEALDLAKRAMDGQIESAMRGQNPDMGVVRHLTNVRNTFIQELDNASPGYAKARAASGDYLSLTKAMDDGLKFDKLDPEILKRTFKGLSDAEKTAFKSGIGKRMRDLVDDTIDNRNAYNKLMGSETRRERLSKVLSPTEYKNLEVDLKAQDRIFKLKNQILGGSPTMSKAEAASEIAGLGSDIASGGITNVPKKALTDSIKKSFDGLDDKTAKQVSNILYETRPSEKLKLITQMRSTKAISKPERESALRAFYETQDIIDQIKKQRGATAFAGGAALGMETNE